MWLIEVYAWVYAANNDLSQVVYVNVHHKDATMEVKLVVESSRLIIGGTNYRQIMPLYYSMSFSPKIHDYFG